MAPPAQRMGADQAVRDQRPRARAPRGDPGVAPGRRPLDPAVSRATHVVIADVVSTPMPAWPGIIPALHTRVLGADARRLAVLTRHPLVVRLNAARDRLGGKFRLLPDVGPGVRLVRRRVVGPGVRWLLVVHAAADRTPRAAPVRRKPYSPDAAGALADPGHRQQRPDRQRGDAST